MGKEREEEETVIGLEDAEREAIRTVRRHLHGKDRNITIDTSDIKEVGDLPVFEISGTVHVVTKPGGFLRKERTEERYFTVKVDAREGRVLGCRI